MAKPASISFDLSDDMLLALGQAAQRANCPPSEYLRAVLRVALDRSPARLRAVDEDIRLAIALSADWFDLQHRLRRCGFVLRMAAGGDLMIHSWPRNQPMLPLATIGQSHAGLVLRFGAPFPGHFSGAPSDAPSAEAVPAPIADRARGGLRGMQGRAA